MNQFADSAFVTPRGPPCRLSPAVRLKWNMTSHSPATLWYMFIGPDAGCQDVPDPIAPMGITLCALEPTRTPIPSSDITISGPMFIDPEPDMSTPLAPGVASRS